MLFAAAVIQTASASADVFAQSATALQVAAQEVNLSWSALGAGFYALGQNLACGKAPADPLAPLLAADQAGWQTMATESAASQGAAPLQVTVKPWTHPTVRAA
jgi:hypothetical protein